MPQAKPIPQGYHTLTPYLTVHNGAAAIDFYKKAFGASELYHLNDAQGRVSHCEMQIGDSRFMLADENPNMGSRSPKRLDGSPVSLLLYVANVDEVARRAIEAGAKEVSPVRDHFYGDRMGGLEDPFGHRWYVATHIEDVPPEQMAQRAAEFERQRQRELTGQRR
jgi:PhnB protein